MLRWICNRLDEVYDRTVENESKLAEVFVKPDRNSKLYKDSDCVDITGKERFPYPPDAAVTKDGVYKVTDCFGVRIDKQGKARATVFGHGGNAVDWANKKTGGGLFDSSNRDKKMGSGWGKCFKEHDRMAGERKGSGNGGSSDGDGGNGGGNGGGNSGGGNGGGNSGGGVGDGPRS